MTIERRNGRVLDPGTGRWYKDGFAPFQLLRPIPATCSLCRGEAVLYPAGLVCRTGCSSPAIEGEYLHRLERSRVRAGYMPWSELIDGEE